MKIKKYCCLMAAILVCMASYGQKALDENVAKLKQYRELYNAGVINVPGKSAEQLYEKAKRWYRDQEKRLWCDYPVEKKLSGYGVFGLSEPNLEIHYDVYVELVKEYCKYEIYLGLIVMDNGREISYRDMSNLVAIDIEEFVAVAEKEEKAYVRERLEYLRSALDELKTALDGVESELIAGIKRDDSDLEMTKDHK